jgi:hypothetical protein
MSYEKMKESIDPIIWEHWQNMHDTAVIRRAEQELRREIEGKILTDFKYYAEYQLLCLKLGIENTLTNRL